MLINISEEGRINEELYLKLTKAIYQLYQWGVPVSETIKIGKIIVENYWREKNADKSGPDEKSVVKTGA